MTATTGRGGTPPVQKPQPPPRPGSAAPAHAGELTRPLPGLRPPKILIQAVEGFGKTTIGAHAPDPVILMAGDSGYLTLAGAGRVPSVDCLETHTWGETMAAVGRLRDTAHKTIVLDGAGGLQAQCFERVCANDYKGSWETFMAYQAGPRNASNGEWLKFLSGLEQTGKAVVMLSHAKPVNFKNPLGVDFQRYSADLYPELYNATARWVDAVLFGTFLCSTEEDKKTKRIKGSTDIVDRVLYTERRDAYDAKNRYGMPAALDMNVEPSEMWSVIFNAIKGGSK